MGSENKNLPVDVRKDNVRHLICVFRDVQVMVDADLAALYGVETKVLNQTVKRNQARFPESFRFQLTESEYEELVKNCDRFHLMSQSVTSSGHGGRRYLPYVFTEQGVAMLSAVLRSKTAIQISIHIINAFVAMRRYLAAGGGLIQRMDTLEKRQIGYEIKTDAQYPPITIHEFADSHDRFLILDGETVYHLGASLKDLGKKWFAFSRMDKSGLKVMERVKSILGGFHD